MSVQLGLVIDQERCIGCEACTVACKNENQGAVGFMRVRTQDAVRKDVPAGTFPDLRMTFMPLVCNHCENPPCAEICPLGAITKRQDGIVVLNQEACDGCRACVDACPYAAISFDEEKEAAEKCNLCVHRIDRGLAPFCVVCCEGQAIHFGNLNDPEQEAGRLAGRETSFQLLKEQGTGPWVFYCPQMEPRGV
jgi:Fe-S-cluster-containing dehydrogenase component